MTPAVETAGAAFAPLLASLHAACFAEAWDAAAFRNLLLQPGVLALIVREGDVPAGFVLGRSAAGEAEILTIGIVAARRRAGLGRVLVDALATRLPPGTDSLFLEVATGNEAAQRLYGGCGFREVGRRARYYPDGQDALVLRRDLRPKR